MIFNVSGGGGTALNFRVVGGTEAPANPAANCIWVNTDVDITGWVFSAEEPSPAEPGMVWIRIDTSSPVAFNALKKNGIMVYPMSAIQYVGGTWVSKPAKSYQGGWVDWILRLYNPGNEFEEVTGGFSKAYENSVGTRTLTKNSDSLFLQTAGTSSGGANFTVATENLIDLTSFSTLYARIAFTNSKYTRFYLAAGTSKNAGLSGDCAFYTSASTEGVVELDISNLSGEYYVWVGLGGTQASNSGNCYVYEVYLK